MGRQAGAVQNGHWSAPRCAKPNHENNLPEVRAQASEAAGVPAEEGKVLVDSVTFGSPAAEAGLEFDQQILRVRAPTDRSC